MAYMEIPIQQDKADLGYWARELEEHTISIGFKEKEIIALNKGEATPEEIDNAITRHLNRMRNPVGAV